MTIIYALMVLLVRMLVTTGTSLYGLLYSYSLIGEGTHARVAFMDTCSLYEPF